MRLSLRSREKVVPIRSLSTWETYLVFEPQRSASSLMVKPSRQDTFSSAISSMMRSSISFPLLSLSEEPEYFSDASSGSLALPASVCCAVSCWL